MDKRTEQAFAYLEKNEHSMMELLKNLVSIETPSADREANERIAAVAVPGKIGERKNL